MHRRILSRFQNKLVKVQWHAKHGTELQISTSGLYNTIDHILYKVPGNSLLLTLFFRVNALVVTSSDRDII
jgi:hypothetical protein